MEILAGAKRSRIIQKIHTLQPTHWTSITSDYVAIQAETIMASLKEQPPNKPITLEMLLSEEDGVPIVLGELFSQIANSLCCGPRGNRFFIMAIRKQKLSQTLTEFRLCKEFGWKLRQLAKQTARTIQ